MKHGPESLKKMKAETRIPILTAYNTPIARCLECAGVPVILVGDTVGMVEMGFESTRSVTVDHMEYHVGAVRRGAQHTHIVGDLPYGSDDEPETALNNARRLLAAGADSVKLEGPKYEVIRYLVENGVAVMGHTGLTPQTAPDFSQVGRAEEDADRIVAEAQGVESAGAYLVILEHIPESLGHRITQSVNIPTVGIGAGSYCDGQVLVINDAIGLGDEWPPFSCQYAYVGRSVTDAAREFVREVRTDSF